MTVTKRIILPWPNSVYVIDPDLFHIDDSKPGCDNSNWPYSLPLGVQAELREKQPSIYQFNVMLDIWTGVFTQINHYVATKRLYEPLPNGKTKKNSNRYTRIDLYNATWAALGYTIDQCPKALQLLALAEVHNKKRPFVHV